MIRKFKWVTMVIFIIIAILIRIFIVGNKPIEQPVENPIQYIVVGEDDYELFYGDRIIVGTNVGSMTVTPEVVEPVSNTDELKLVEPKEDSSIYWLSRIIHAEANGESIDGKIAVGNVVMNRVESDEFPNTIKEVIFEKGQFSPVSNGTIYNEPSNDAIRSATMVLDGETVVEDRALFFYNPQIVSRGNWIRSRQVVEVIGNHTFCE